MSRIITRKQLSKLLQSMGHTSRFTSGNFFVDLPGLGLARCSKTQDGNYLLTV